MKYLVLILFLSLLGCSEDKSDCNCNAKYAIFKNGNVSYFYVNNVKIDCSTNKPLPNQNIQGDAVFIRCE